MHTFLQDETGATSIEYAFIAVLVAVVMVTALGALGSSLTLGLDASTDQLTTAS